jgi:hypothetical protein
MASLAALIVLLQAGGCPVADEPDDAYDPPPPEVPEDLDPSEYVVSFRTWYLVGNALTEGGDALELVVKPPGDAGSIDAWIDGQFVVQVDVSGDEQAVDAPIGDLPPGEHVVLLAAAGASEAFAQLTLIRTHPYYVLVTNDWDDSEHSEGVLNLQEKLYEDNPGFKQTHFVGPYTFTDPVVTAEQIGMLVDWVIAKHDDNGDEIGLHIHPYCNFIETTSVTCLHEPSFAYDVDETGYTIDLSAYTLEQTEILAAQAIVLFEANGLGRPTSFRAGGWTAQLHTLEALQNSGFVADTSANNWARLEEWEGQPDASLYEWNAEHWATIDEWSQPYYPSADDILDDSEPTLDILEVPDNGCLVDYVTVDEIEQMFHAGWDGGALDQPLVYVTGYHPTSYGSHHFTMEAGLQHISGHLNREDAGPVVYETVSAMAIVFAKED